VSYWDPLLARDLSGAECTNCGRVGRLRLELRPLEEPQFIAQQTPYSLSGSQLKVSAHRIDEWPWMVCDACGGESEGKFG
jgi:hypothetical protein